MGKKSQADDAKWGAKKHFAFKGFLEVIPLSDIFNLLHLGNRTGSLVVTRENRTFFVYLHDGLLLCISSDGDRWRLLELLLHTLDVPLQKQRELQAVVKGKDAMLPDLVAMGIISKEKLEKIARTFLIQEMCGLFLWSRGEFEFLDHKIPPEDFPVLAVDVPFAVMEAMRNLDDIRRGIPWLDDDGTIPCLIAFPDVNEATVTLNLDEWRLIAYMDGLSTIADMCARATELGDFRVYNSMSSLAKRGLLQKKCSKEISTTTSDLGARSEQIRNLADQTIHGADLSEKVDHALMADSSAGHIEVAGREGSLILKRNGKMIREFFLSKGGAQIGRSESCDIVLKNDPTISRLHARVVITEKGFLIRDLNSANGVFVNNNKITEHLLVDGDEIQIGSYYFAFQEAKTEAEHTANPVLPA